MRHLFFYRTSLFLFPRSRLLILCLLCELFGFGFRHGAVSFSSFISHLRVNCSLIRLEIRLEFGILHAGDKMKSLVALRSSMDVTESVVRRREFGRAELGFC